MYRNAAAVHLPMAVRKLKVKKSIIILLILLFVGLVAFFAIGLYKVYYLEGITDRSIENFTEGKMKKYDGGSDALEFFRKYSDNSDYSDCKFYYTDDRVKDSFFHKYCSSFILDLKYETEKYGDIKNRLTNADSIESSGANRYQLLYSESKIDNSTAAIFANDDEQVIRLVFLYGDIVEKADISSLLMWNTDCNWS